MPLMLRGAVYCCACDRPEVCAFDEVPTDWTIITRPGEHFGLASCPDCLHIVLPEDDGGPVEIPNQATALFGAISPDLTFSSYLQRTADGYSIAMSPCRVMTLFQPLTYLLAPDEAEAFARDLLRLVDLARNPGTMGTGA